MRARVMGSASRPPRERGVNMRNNPDSCNTSGTGRDRRRSRSVSSLCSCITGAIRRAASIRVVSGLNFYRILLPNPSSVSSEVGKGKPCLMNRTFIIGGDSLSLSSILRSGSLSPLFYCFQILGASLPCESPSHLPRLRDCHEIISSIEQRNAG